MHSLNKILFEQLRSMLFVAGAVALLVSNTASADPVLVAMIKSAQRPEYEQTSGSIINTFAKNNADVKIEEIQFPLSSVRKEAFWTEVIRKRPELIITMGTAATRSAAKFVENIPIIFTMVLDDAGEFMQNSETADVHGVTLSIPLKDQLKMLRKALPGTRRVGLIYGRSSAQLYRNAGEIASEENLRLIVSEVASERDIPSMLRRMISEVDVLWMPPDALTYEQNILRFILLECYKNSVPIIAVSKRIAMAGTPLALGIDYQDLGRQTAEMALRKLAGRLPAGSSPEHPGKVLLYINKGVASSLGLDIPQHVIEQAITVDSWR